MATTRTWRRVAGRTVRGRTTLVAAAATGLVLVLTSVVLVVAQQRTLTTTTDRALDLRLDDVAGIVARDDGADATALGRPDDTESLVQVVGRTGAVVAAGPNAVGLPRWSTRRRWTVGSPPCVASRSTRTSASG